MADLVVTDLTFTVTREVRREGGTRPYRVVQGTILIPVTSDYAAGGVPISGVTNSVTGAVVAANALACPGLGCPNEVVELEVLSNGNAAGLDDAFTIVFDRGVAGTKPHKLRILKPGAFTGSAPASHTHDLKVIGGQGAAGTDAVTAPAGTDLLGKQEAGNADILGADVATKGGVVGTVDATPAGTIAVRLAEHAAGALAEALTVYVQVKGF